MEEITEDMGGGGSYGNGGGLKEEAVISLISTIR